MLLETAVDCGANNYKQIQTENNKSDDESFAHQGRVKPILNLFVFFRHLYLHGCVIR